MNKKLLMTVLAVGMVYLTSMAKDPVKIPLGTDKDAGVMYVYPADKSSGVAVVGCPGGGYAMKAMDHEGFDFAGELNNLGVTYAVVDYRLPHGQSEVPGDDVRKAIKIMREHAKEWGIDKTGVMGFSAGGHLASTVATHYDKESRPDFQILFYPVITMDPEYTHMGSRANLLGENPSKDLEVKYSNEMQITENTPPALIFHCSDDNVVPVANAVNYYTALQRHGVPSSLHIFPSGGHGWGFHDSYQYKSQWLPIFRDFLTSLKTK